MVWNSQFSSSELPAESLRSKCQSSFYVFQVVVSYAKVPYLFHSLPVVALTFYILILSISIPSNGNFSLMCRHTSIFALINQLPRTGSFDN